MWVQAQEQNQYVRLLSALVAEQYTSNILTPLLTAGLMSKAGITTMKTETIRKQELVPTNVKNRSDQKTVRLVHLTTGWRCIKIAKKSRLFVEQFDRANTKNVKQALAFFEKEFQAKKEREERVWITKSDAERAGSNANGHCSKNGNRLGHRHFCVQHKQLVRKITLKNAICLLRGRHHSV